jgi:hypothetical protein
MADRQGGTRGRVETRTLPLAICMVNARADGLFRGRIWGRARPPQLAQVLAKGDARYQWHSNGGQSMSKAHEFLWVKVGRWYFSGTPVIRE